MLSETNIPFRPTATRRTFIAAGLATASVASLAACTRYGDNAAPSVVPPEENTPGSPAGKTLAPTSNIPVGGGLIIAEEKIVVTQPEPGKFKAFSAVCTHAGCAVASVDNGTINCPCHGSKFHITDGGVARGPATSPLPAVQIAVDGDTVRRT
ncbi:Rieske (2Fe-2S) protein [Streptomyces sp. NPDC052013]|uniref:Rieske (2Fe-2S) protein n=1 Tax=Streptomyces sp. NPDC052013 TaxID=3365679 RepID=UPI0037CF8DDE